MNVCGAGFIVFRHRQSVCFQRHDCQVDRGAGEKRRRCQWKDASACERSSASPTCALSDGCVAAEWQGPAWLGNHSDSASARGSGMGSRGPVTPDLRCQNWGISKQKIGEKGRSQRKRRSRRARGGFGRSEGHLDAARGLLELTWSSYRAVSPCPSLTLMLS